jgi:hypothetical protein
MDHNELAQYNMSPWRVVAFHADGSVEMVKTWTRPLGGHPGIERKRFRLMVANHPALGPILKPACEVDSFRESEFSLSMPWNPPDAQPEPAIPDVVSAAAPAGTGWEA